jgi:hypothetical protein
VLTGTQVLLLVVSETGLVYTFTTPKLQPLVTKPEGKNLIQVRPAPIIPVAATDIWTSSNASMPPSRRAKIRTAWKVTTKATRPKMSHIHHRPSQPPQCHETMASPHTQD